MADESPQHSASFELHASPDSHPTPPPWAAEAIVTLRAFWARWTLMPLSTQVRVARKRSGTFDVLDFVSVLLAYAASGATTLKAYYEQARPIEGALAGLWLRDKRPSRSALSRFLADVTAPPVEALRTLF